MERKGEKENYKEKKEGRNKGKKEGKRRGERRDLRLIGIKDCLYRKVVRMRKQTVKEAGKLSDIMAVFTGCQTGSPSESDTDRLKSETHTECDKKQ